MESQCLSDAVIIPIIERLITNNPQHSQEILEGIDINYLTGCYTMLHPQTTAALDAALSNQAYKADVDVPDRKPGRVDFGPFAEEHDRPGRLPLLGNP